jgi:hypothetical protein
MKAKISASSLAGLSETARKRYIMKIFRQAQAVATEEREKLINELKAEVRVYELRNRLESAKLKEALDNRQIDETPEVASWLLVYQAIQKLEKVSDTAGTA